MVLVEVVVVVVVVVMTGSPVSTRCTSRVLETGVVLCRHANEVMRVMGIRVGMVVVVMVTGSPVSTRCTSRPT